MEYLFHGSNKFDLKEILPFINSRNAYKEEVSCYSTSYLIALLYIRNTKFHWISFDFDEKLNATIYTEHFPGMLEVMYKGVSGSVYFVEKENPIIKASRFKNMYIANEPIIPFKEIVIGDVYNEILEHEKNHELIVNRFETLSESKIKQIEDIVFSSIIKEKLIIDPWEKSDWVKRHIFKVWKKAVHEYLIKPHKQILDELN